MEYLILYFIFALTTAIAVQYVIIGPALREAILLLDKGDPIYDNPRLAAVTFFLMSIIVAPVVFIVYLSTAGTQTFKDALVNSLTGAKFQS
jgi:hypothetical protein